MFGPKVCIETWKQIASEIQWLDQSFFGRAPADNSAQIVECGQAPSFVARVKLTKSKFHGGRFVKRR